ncbi:hypothetical protein [Duganella fentianensis]|uniref:hypothetical protein n=1 Tax=Duganella fentianensis TaxID=2692177 RepID=UPI0019272525
MKPAIAVQQGRKSIASPDAIRNEDFCKKLIAVAAALFWTQLHVTGGQPAELAGVYVRLASNEASYATGQVYGAVGGNGGP